MNPVIGLDVAKGESQVQAFLQRKQTCKESFKFNHDLPGLHTFHHFYEEVENISGQPPAIIFESTGHYHEPVLQFLENKGISYYLINPMVSFEARKTSLRKVKTDKALNLRLLTRQHSALTDSYVEIKLQFQVALDCVFPEYHSVFSDLYGKLSLNTLLSYPTALDIHKVSEEILAEEMRQFGARRSYTWLLDKAWQLKEAVKRNPFQSQISHGQLISLRMYIQMLFQYQEHLIELLKEIGALAKSFEEYGLIQSVPGI